MKFDQELVNEVLKRANIVDIISSYLTVTKKGKEYLALCPFHDDSSPSLHISPDKQIFKCFVDGTGGSAITFVQKYEHISFAEALVKVAKMVGYDDPRFHEEVHVKPVDQRKETLLKCTRDLTTYYQYALSTSEGKEGLDYFESRNLDANLRAKFRLGYAFKNGQATCKYLLDRGHSLKTLEDIGIASINSGITSDRNQGRVIFPIMDEDGEPIGYSARRIAQSDEAKYINSPETYLFHKSSVLYNYHIAKEKARIAGYVYLLEGFMDVFALAKIGIESAVAVMGTALTPEHIGMLRKLNVEVRVCLDGDLPGQTATLKVARALDEAGIKFRIVDAKGNTKDPDEILNQDGEAALRYYLNDLVYRADFALNYYLKSNPLKTLDEKKVLIKQFIPILQDVQSQLELDSYLRKLSEITGFEVESIRDLLKKARRLPKEANVTEVMTDFHPERKVLKKLFLAEREMLFQMINNKEAVLFYETKINVFYDEIYRQIASFIVECYKNNSYVDLLNVMTLIETSEPKNAEELTNELVNLAMEKNHPSECTLELLNGLLDSMNEEKTNISEKDMLEDALRGKDELTQARILADYNRRKMLREEKKEKAIKNTRSQVEKEDDD